MSEYIKINNEIVCNNIHIQKWLTERDNLYNVDKIL